MPLKNNKILRLLLLISMSAIVFIFNDYIKYMLAMWSVHLNSDSKFFFIHYHSFLLAPLAVLLIVHTSLNQVCRAKSGYLGVIVLIVGLFCGLFGGLSSIYYLANIGFILSLIGLLMACFGADWLRINWKPLALLLLLVPMPQFILIRIFSYLTTLATNISVYVSQFLGLTVFFEGNVVDFGSYSRSSLDIGSPFSYLFLSISLGVFLLNFTPLGVFRYVVTFLVGPVTLFSVTVFRAVWMVWVANSLGESAVQTFDIASSGVTILGIVVTIQILVFAFLKVKEARKDKSSDSQQIVNFLYIKPRMPAISLQTSLIICFAVIMFATLLSTGISVYEDREMPRTQFENFPTTLGSFQSSPASVDLVELKSMQLKDYLSENFSLQERSENINVWIAYYANQKAGGSIHSPKACLSGSGWEISDYQVVTLNGLRFGSKNITLNRAIMKYGSQRKLLYFWYVVAGRPDTNEYLVKWHIFWSKLTKHRSDGALIRLITDIGESNTEESADERLQGFMREFLPTLSPFIPNI